MVERIYLLIWVLLALAIGVFILSGNLNADIVVGLGFAAFSLTFMGMIGVLPYWTTHNSPKQ